MKIEYPFDEVDGKIRKMGSPVSPHIGLEIEFAFDGLSQFFIRNSQKVFGEHIDSKEEFVKYIERRVTRHPLFSNVYTDPPNLEFCTAPMTKEVLYDVEPFISFLFLKLKSLHFYVRPYSNVDINYDPDYYSPSDWKNLFKFLYRNNEFLIFFSYRRQSAQDKVDFISLTEEFAGPFPFSRKRGFLKRVNEFCKNLTREHSSMVEVCNVHTRLGIDHYNRAVVKRIEVKWFGNPFNYKTILSFIEMIDCIINFKRQNKSNSIDDLYTFLSDHCTDYKYFHSRVRGNPFGYLHGIEQNTNL